MVGSFWRPQGSKDTAPFGDLIYFGTGLASVWGGGTEPALLDPSLPADRWAGECRERRLSAWLRGYDESSIEARSAYLWWLQTGRKDPQADLGCVWIYFYGLERRALHDVLTEPAAVAEQPLIAAEVARLQSVYHTHRPFREKASELLAFLEAALAPERLYETAPEMLAIGGLMSLRQQVALGQCARERAPLPASWAYLWALKASQSPRQLHFRPPKPVVATRFAHAYHQRYGAGLLLPPDGPTLSLEYRPKSPSFAGARVIQRLTVPDVVGHEATLDTLTELLTEARAARSGALRSSDPADAAAPPAKRQRRATMPEICARVLRAAGEPVEVPVAELRHLAAGLRPLTHQEWADLNGQFQQQGIGMEPSPLFASRPSGQTVCAFLFADDRVRDCKQGSPKYRATAVVVQLAVHIVQGQPNEAQHARILELIRKQACSLAERRRLHALLCWALTQPLAPQPSRGQARLLLTGPTGAAAADFLIEIAWDGSPGTPEAGRRLANSLLLLGLDSVRVFDVVLAVQQGLRDHPVRRAEPPAG